MPFALLLALAAVAGGTLLTYSYDRRASLPARLCAGTCTGFAALALVGFVIASFVGLTPRALLLAGVVVALPLALLGRPGWLARVRGDLNEASRSLRRALTLKGGAGTVVFYAVAAVLCWWVFAQAMYETPEGIFTGLENNIGDLPFHVGIITGFVHGENFPPEHPEFAGARLTYPFLADFLTAMFARAGASLEGAVFWQNLALALSFVGLLHRWALELTRDRMAALLTPAVVLFNGGLGFLRFFREAWSSGRGLLASAGELTSYYTVAGDAYKWANAVVTLLVPQRGLLLGFPLAMVVWTLWWQGMGPGAGEEVDDEGEASKGGAARDRKKQGAAKGQQKREEKQKQRKQEGKQKDDDARLTGNTARAALETKPTRRGSESPASGLRPPAPAFPVPAVAAGVVAGLLPLVHAHSFVVLMSMGACVAVLFCVRWPWAEAEDGAGRGALLPCWREWAAFFAAASCVAVPQMVWATYASDVQAASFFAWQPGWDSGKQSFVVFWLKNTGLFIPLLVAAVAWRGARPVVPKRLLLFLAPFALCFVVPNLFKLSPWIWDNIKILFYWWIAASPLVALLLARLWRLGAGWRAVAVGLLAALTLAGALDVWRVASGVMRHQVFARGGVQLAELVRRETAPRSLILHAPTYNHPVFLTGRRSMMGYVGHLGSHGLDFKARERDLLKIYAGGVEAEGLLKSYGVDYVVVGPLELRGAEMRGMRAYVNESFFQRYTKVGEAGGYSLYKTSP